MEKLPLRKPSVYIATGLSAAAFAGCSLDSYLTNPADVQCDGKRTKVDLKSEGMATFVVHGLEDGDVATVQVRRTADGVSVSTTGDTAGAPPQRLEEDGFTKATPIVEGAELSTFGAGGAWVIDAREDSVVIQGSCEGM